MRSWIDIGTPDPARLHRAAKLAPRVAVYVHRDPTQFLGRLAGERIHRGEAIELYEIDRGLIGAFCSRLDRRMGFALSVADRELTLSLETETLSGAVTRLQAASRR
jgi:uncharacterized protein YaeQ